MSTKVHTIARVRPLLAHERSEEVPGITVDEQCSAVRVVNPRNEHEIWKFPFSSVYGPESTTRSIYEKDVKPRVEKVVSGTTLTVFAYGVTSSGKTYTMQGTGKAGDDGGLIDFIVDQVFQPQNTTITMQFMEIYKDDVYDLLIPRNKASKLTIRASSTNEVTVPELTMTQPLSSPAELRALYSKAVSQRAVGSTNLNHESSRSHSILTLHVSTRQSDGRTFLGKVNLVDLAGSENNKLTGAAKERLSESSAINKSLTVLGMVVEAINRGDARIPYRDSKLTRILQDALGGGSSAILILNLPPSSKMRNDALNSIHFATRTKNIENRVVINEIANVVPPSTSLSNVYPRGPVLSARPSLSSNVEPANQRRISSIPVPKKVMNRYGPASLDVGSHVFEPLGSLSSDNQESRIPKDELDKLVKKLVEQEVEKRFSAAGTAEAGIDVTKGLKSLDSADHMDAPPSDDDMAAIEHDNQHEAQETHSSRPVSGLSQGYEQQLEKDEMLRMNAELRQRLEELEERIDRTERQPVARVSGSHPGDQTSRPTTPSFSSEAKSMPPATPDRSVATSSIADMLSPAARKKAGRAYVQLARAHCEKGALTTSLELYKKAGIYVPDNTRLQERILDLEYACRNQMPFVPSPHLNREKRKEKCRHRSEDLGEDDKRERKRRRRDESEGASQRDV